MICPNCEKNIYANSNTCMYCGCDLSNANDSMDYDLKLEEPVIITNPTTRPAPVSVNPAVNTELGMKWFYFIVYVQLIVNCLSYILNGIQLITGNHYIISGINYRRQMYSLIPKLQFLDIIFIIFSFSFAIFALIVRNSLKKFKRNAPMLYIIAQICVILYTLASGFFYTHIITSELGIQYSNPDTFSKVFYNFVFIFINIYYFRNRKHLFIND